MKQLSIRSLAITLFLSCIAAATVTGQVSRSRNKIINPYRSNYQRMAAGYDAECSYEIRNGALWAVGRNAYGQLGDGSTTDRYNPVQVGTATNWVSITGADHFALGITSDGKLWGWGYNAGGQLGDGTTIDKHTPTQIGTATNWVCVAGGGLTTAAISADGKLWAWGNNSYGQLGDGTLNNRTAPAQVGSATDWVNVTCGRGAILALSADGKIWGCGRNSTGHLGDGTFTNKSFFTAIPGTTRWSSLSSGPYHALAISADGKLYAWGNNFIGQLGDGTLVNKNTPTLIGGTATWVCASAGSSHGLAVKTDGTLWSWGANSNGALGDGTTTNQTVPVQAGTATNWVDIAGGGGHSLGLSADGNLWAWGYGAYGQLGTGNGSEQHTPVKTQGSLAQWLSVTGGYSYEAMIKGDGTLWTVGRNAYGQLGDGSGGLSNSKMIPVQVGTGNSWVATAAGLYHCLAIKADGTLWAWGNGGYGALGYGGTNDQKTPIQVGTDNKWASISCGETHTAALKSDGTIWCWGYNYGYGNNGNGTNTNNYTPVQSGTDNDWASVAVGRYTTYAIKANGTMWAWGRNYSGQVGDNTTTDQWSPVQVGTSTNWISVNGSSDHAVALQADGTLWAWGANYNSILGDGTSTDRHVPTQLGASHNWLRISTTLQNAKAIDASGALWAWGDNTYGELGDGTFATRTTPTLITGQSDVVSFMYSAPESLTPGIIKVARDKICLTGNNASGELADGTTTTSSAFNCSNYICPAYSIAGATTTYSQPLGGTGTRIDFQTGCGIAAAVTPTNAALASGNITAKIWIEPGVPAYAGTPYLARHFELTPAANASTSSGTVTLYCTQAEFTAYNAAPNHGPNLPVDATDAANNKANLRITKKSGVSSDGSGLPGTYSSTNTVITPGSVIWDASGSRWAVTFSTTGFSGFFINSSSNPLPVRLIAFSAKPLANTVRLDWQVADQKEMAAYTIQRSADGNNYTDLTSMPADSRADYSAIDAVPLEGRSYYRLKMEGLDGSISYSNTESVMMNSGATYFTLSPQPARSLLTIVTNDALLNGSIAVLTDMQGRTLQSFLIRTGGQRISLEGVQPGLYMLRVGNGRSWKVIKE